MKTCSRCSESFPLSEFYRDASKADGLHPKCKSCHRAYKKTLTPAQRERDRRNSKRWRKENPQKAKEGVRNATLKRKYGIGIEEFNRILEKQRGCCAICGDSDNGVSWGKNLHVDHCHRTGVVRGILCQPCNTSIGKMKDSPELLRKAAKYLEDTRRYDH